MSDLMRDVENELKKAKAAAQARAKAAQAAKAAMPDIDYTLEECFVQLTIAMYALGLRVSFGVLPDGMAVFARLNIPLESEDTRAGMVSFVASSDALGAARKAVYALQSSAESNFWKKDDFARPKARP